jgi:hypothetical protein
MTLTRRGVLAKEPSKMTHGGAREGAGRKPKFIDRSSIHVYIDEAERQQFLCIIEYLKNEKQDPGISASDTLLQLAREFMRGISEEHYIEWAEDNPQWLKENYPLEHKRLNER